MRLIVRVNRRMSDGTETGRWESVEKVGKLLRKIGGSFLSVDGAIYQAIPPKEDTPPEKGSEAFA